MSIHHFAVGCDFSCGSASTAHRVLSRSRFSRHESPITSSPHRRVPTMCPPCAHVPMCPPGEGASGETKRKHSETSFFWSVRSVRFQVLLRSCSVFLMSALFPGVISVKYAGTCRLTTSVGWHASKWLSESILSRYARELAMEQLFAWMASRITSSCLRICWR